MSVSIDLSSTSALIFGVANHRSIAWSIAKCLHDAGAHLTITYQNERLKRSVYDLTKDLDNIAITECDVTDEAALSKAFSIASSMSTLSTVIHSVAFAQREELEGNFSLTTPEGFRLALEISAYSLIPIARLAGKHMTQGGSVITMTFHASEKVYPGYNVMGVAKAALENEVIQLASEYGERNIRFNAISAGPLNTLAARGIHGYAKMEQIHAARAPLRRNISQDEVASTALFLASNLSSGITGATIPVDAGYNIMGV